MNHKLFRMAVVVGLPALFLSGCMTAVAKPGGSMSMESQSPDPVNDMIGFLNPAKKILYVMPEYEKAVLEAIAYCESNPPELLEDYAREEALLEASGMNDPNYKYHPTPRLLTPQEIAQINRS